MSGIFTATERVVAPKLPAQWIRSATFALQISFFDGQTIHVRARAPIHRCSITAVHLPDRAQMGTAINVQSTHPLRRVTGPCNPHRPRHFDR